jgi:hypothetical protein
MTCKVVRLINRDRLVLLHISGHLQEMHINMIDDILTKETDPVALDLEEMIPTLPLKRPLVRSPILLVKAEYAISDSQGNEQNDIDIRRRQLDASVLLLKALGRDWNVNKLPKV